MFPWAKIIVKRPLIHEQETNVVYVDGYIGKIGCSTPVQ